VANERPKITKCYKCIKNCNPKTIPYCITAALIHAAKGETDQGLIFCGANAYKAEKMESVRDVMNEFTIPLP
ncbi:MAG: nitronate monooxygenase, partial [Clostridiales bacterium]|nr:nitronate monooxygenase [Clostridiales bacterium]